jgi:anti-sigma factor ChrR (cupin superfamily)
MSACNQLEFAAVYALRALPGPEASKFASHLGSCEDCRRELATMSSVVDSFAAWPADVLRPSSSLQDRLARRIAAERGRPSIVPPPSDYREPEWEEVAPGIFCKLLANDPERDRVSMLVRLLPGVEYPPHTHAGLEELYLLDGELWIDERKLYPGDYNRAEAPSGDKRVWSETGCTCVLITSTKDILS